MHGFLFLSPNFEKKWVVLKEGYLNIYDDSLQTKVTESIKLQSCLCRPIFRDDLRFEIEFKNKISRIIEKLTFRAENELIAKTWIINIQQTSIYELEEKSNFTIKHASSC